MNLDSRPGGLLASPPMDDTAALYGLREAADRLCIVLHRNYPRLAALPYEVRTAVERLMQAMATPWIHVLQSLRPGDVVLVHMPVGEAPQVLQETYARIRNLLPEGVTVLTETSGVYLDHIPAPTAGDVILVRVRRRQDPDELVALGNMTRTVFGGAPTVVVQDDTHDVQHFNESEMRRLGWTRSPSHG